VDARAPAAQEPLALAFANTLRSDRPGRDLLAGADAASRWLVERGLPGEAASSVARLRDLRAAVRHLVDLRARRAPLDPAAVGLINAAVSRAPVLRTLDLASGSPRIKEEHTTEDPFSLVAAAIASSAVELLGEDGERVAACQGKGCRLYFVGGRRNRRWCSSKVCGNRARVAAYAARRVARADPTPAVTA
jgi:predicted RNA-binding Zn ribbon-like protein